MARAATHTADRPTRTERAAADRPTRAERAAAGKRARRHCPLTDLAQVGDRSRRPDPVGLLGSQDAMRDPELVPIRYGRMLTSPFAFFRGAALVMAADLAAAPSPGLRVQLCGDAHVANFGVFGTPERRLVFDLNDFDETAPGPFEWDVTRLATSLEVVGRTGGYTAAQRRRVVLTAAAGYREAMRDLATQGNLDVWYARLDVEQLLEQFRPLLRPKGRRLSEKTVEKAHTRDRLHALDELTTTVDGRPRIVSHPPLVVPVEDLFPDQDVARLYAYVDDLLHGYRRTLPASRRRLLDQYALEHMARKVVGVGSVGTRAWILLMQGVDGSDPVFLQAKEAHDSVLEAFAGPSRYRHHGQRVVQGQLLMQSASDIFLGWQRTTAEDGVARDYYVRQLRDWKASPAVEGVRPAQLRLYAQLCGWTLARAHARSGDRVALAAYLGRRTTFDEAVADAAAAHADQNERDVTTLQEAATSGRVHAVTGR